MIIKKWYEMGMKEIIFEIFIYLYIYIISDLMIKNILNGL